MINRRRFIGRSASIAGLTMLPSWVQGGEQQAEAPILVAIELSGGNDGLNTIVPYADDAYYQARPTIGIPKDQLFLLDDHFGMNPGLLGMHRLWQDGHLAIVHGCGYERPTYSHFNAMAYWHTGAPHSGSAYGWMGRLADEMSPTRRNDMLINVASQQSLAVKSRVHTPVVFDDPDRFQRHRWMAQDIDAGQQTSVSGNASLDYLRAVNLSAQASSIRIQNAWRDYSTDVDYGIAPMDLPKVAACIKAGLPTQLYHVAFRNNSFDTHVQQPALHRRLLSYASDGIHGFVRDLQRMGQAHRVLVMVYSEFGRRVPENANLGTDHGSANVMFLAGEPVSGGHYGQVPSLTALVDGDNLAYTTDFRQVYATVIQNWLGADAQAVLGGRFEALPAVRRT